jgi:hypothetical protein
MCENVLSEIKQVGTVERSTAGVGIRHYLLTALLLGY